MAAMFLLNCRRCDDVLKLTELRQRVCECGQTHGIMVGDQADTNGGRLIELSWEEYDLAAPGETLKCRVR